MSYNFITNPLTNRKVNVHSKLGKQIISNYLLFGGSPKENLDLSDADKVELGISDTKLYNDIITQINESEYNFTYLDQTPVSKYHRLSKNILDQLRKRGFTIEDKYGYNFHYDGRYLDRYHISW